MKRSRRKSVKGDAMPFDIGRQRLDVHCPHCGRTVRTSLHSVERRQAQCPCGLRFEPNPSVGQGIRRVNRAVEDFSRDFSRALKRIGRP